jgi:hypothetical protein
VVAERVKATPTFSVCVPVMESDPPLAGVAAIVSDTVAALAAATSVPIFVVMSLPVSMFEQDMRKAPRDMPRMAACAPLDILTVLFVPAMLSPGNFTLCLCPPLYDSG